MDTNDHNNEQTEIQKSDESERRLTIEVPTDIQAGGVVIIIVSCCACCC